MESAGPASLISNYGRSASHSSATPREGKSQGCPHAGVPVLRPESDLSGEEFTAELVSFASAVTTSKRVRSE
jgi:hypothetical protein